jgi:diacylglycerol kinase (ATP)
LTASVYGSPLLICNPRAGSGAARRDVVELRHHLDARGIEHEVVFTEHRGHATKIARSALKDGRRFLVAVGGDGTIHEVVNGIIEDDASVRADAVLGVAASGTASDFIKTFGIPALPAHAAAHLDGPESFPIDIGKVTYDIDEVRKTRYFCNIAEVGLGAVVARRASSLPRVLGPLLYPSALWLAMMSTRMCQVKIDLVDRSYEGPMFNLVVANGQFFGSGMKIAPRAAPTDGLFDIQVQHASKVEMLAQWPKVYRGEHVPHPDVLEAKRVCASITSERPLPIEADGELLGHTPATFELLKDVLRLKV